MTANEPGAGERPAATVLTRRSSADRPIRIALLVYNDAHADSRVIKTAESLRAAGAVVRIFAIAQARSGYLEGEGVVGDGVPVHRSAEFELVRHAPRTARLARRLLGRGSQPSAPPGPVPASAKPAERRPGTVGEAGSRIVALQRQALARANDVWLRAYRTARLGLYWRQSAEAAAHWRPDVVHANDGNTLAPAMWVARRTGARIVYDAHELWRDRNVRKDRPLAPYVEALIETIGVHRSSAVITVSGSIADWMQRTYRLGERPTLVRNAPRLAEEATASPGASRGALRRLAALGPDTSVIAYGGRITTSRGIEETLAALVHLPDDVHFVLLGYGEEHYLDDLRAEAARLGVADRMHLVGAVEPAQVADALADGDLAVVYVRPVCLSYRFSLPNKLFEAVHAGLPIVAAELPDTAALVRQHGVGEIFDLGSPQDLAAAITRVLAAPETYRAAAVRAARELSWEHEEKLLIELYRRVVSQ